jgi:hypothetical protein
MDQNTARSELQTIGGELRDARSAYVSARKKAIPAIVAALKEKLPLVEIKYWTGYSREQIRRIARQHGIESDRGRWEGEPTGDERGRTF